MRFIDLSKPWLIEQGAARTYLRFYQQAQEQHAAGLPLKPTGVEAERLREQSPAHQGIKNVEQFGGTRIPVQGADKWGDPLKYSWILRDGVATVNVVGPIVRHASWTDPVSQLTSAEVTSKAIGAALVHDEVRAIILNLDSPGGEVTGINELAGYIRQSSAKKPIVAYGDGMVCSAAYWLASACNEIVLSDTGIAGSIGTIWAWLDDSKYLAKQGLEEIEFISTQSPLKNPDPRSRDGKAAYQAIVNELTDVFGGAVAAFRGTTTKNVFENYGRGGIMIGRSAVAAGLVDRLGDYESLVSELGQGSYTPLHATAPSRATFDAQSKVIKNISREATQALSRKFISSNQGGAMDPNAEEREEEQEDIPAENESEDPEADEPEDSEDDQDETNEDDADEDLDEDLSADALEATPENIARLQAKLRTNSRQMASQRQQLEANRKAAAVAARERFAASLQGKVAPVARKSMRSLFNALQAGKATTAHLDAVVAALPRSRALKTIDADLSAVEREKPSDPVADDVKAANEFAEKENARRRGK